LIRYGLTPQTIAMLSIAAPRRPAAPITTWPDGQSTRNDALEDGAAAVE
jgi:hypothetical protein